MICVPHAAKHWLSGQTSLFKSPICSPARARGTIKDDRLQETESARTIYAKLRQMYQFALAASNAEADLDANFDYMPKSNQTLGFG